MQITILISGITGQPNLETADAFDKALQDGILQKQVVLRAQLTVLVPLPALPARSHQLRKAEKMK